MQFSKKGKLFRVKDTQELTSNFKKREFVIDTIEDRYPQKILFNLTNARVDIIDSFKEGDDVNVHFNLRGKGWESPTGEVKYFNSLDAWKIEALNSNGYSPSEPEANFEPSFETYSEDEEDVPF